MTNGISANPLNPITKVYLDQIAKAKKAETQQDIDRWKQSEVGEAYKAVTNAPDSLAKMNKRYKPVKKIKNPTDRPFRDRLKDPEYKVDEEVKMTKKAYNKLHKDFKSDDPKKPRTTKYVPGKGTVSMPVKFVDEAKVDTGSAEEKATARNKRNTPPGANRKFDTSVFITRKPGESLDSARTRKRRDAHAAKRGVSEAKVDTGDDVKKETDRNKRRFGKDAAPRGSGGVEYAQTLVRRREHRAKRGVKENFSNWRDELREVADDIPVTDKEMEKKVTEKKVNNKVVINPKMSEAVEEIGGVVLAAGEVYESQIESAVEYFCEEGINEDGLESIIEEVGLIDFVDFVLDEERAARKMNVRTKKTIGKTIEKDAAAEAKRREKKTGEYAETPKRKPKIGKPGYTTTVKPAPKKVAPKPVVKKEVPAPAPKPVVKKVQKVVSQTKPTQPKKEVSKDGLRDRIRSAVKAGVKRHKKAVQPARVFAKGMKAGAKSAVKFAGKAQKALVGEESKTFAGVKKWMKEADDAAYKNVVASLQQKYGKDSVITKDSPRPKPQAQAKPKPQRPLTPQEKAQREVDAQYGGRENRLAGRGLGT